jgi:predicted lipid-binding transport protein (Tim44 family)
MSSFGGKVMTGSFLAVIGLITLKVLGALFAGFMALFVFLIFKVLPIVLVIWLAMKLFRKKSDKPAYE